MNDSSDRRRWFQFRLRTLLVVVTLAAVASWGYWFAWPRLYSYLERRRFELAASRLKAGVSEKDVTTALAEFQPASRPLEVSDLNANHIRLARFDLSLTSYVIWLRYPGIVYDGSSSTEIRVYRVPWHYRGSLIDELQGNQNPDHEPIYSDPPK